MALASNVQAAITLIKRDVNQTVLSQVEFITSEFQQSTKPVKLYIPNEAADDPAVQHLADGGWSKYTSIVFLTHWQQSMYNLFLGVPYSAGIVMPTAIDAVAKSPKPSTGVNLLFVGDPRNGLDIAFSAFKQLSPRNPDVLLYVFTDFSVYGDLKDKSNKLYAKFAAEVRSHPKVIFHTNEADYLGLTGRVPVFDMCHIMLFPNIHPAAPHTPLLECMSAEMLCIHSSYGSFPEISRGLTSMYGYSEDKEIHLDTFHQELSNAIALYGKVGPRRNIAMRLAHDKAFIDDSYSCKSRSIQWTDFLLNLLTNQ
jgi:glycosyltransferase involved in cell wall biosynthesis